jgi:hypothetical protein
VCQFAQGGKVGFVGALHFGCPDAGVDAQVAERLLQADQRLETIVVRKVCAAVESSVVFNQTPMGISLAGWCGGQIGAFHVVKVRWLRFVTYLVWRNPIARLRRG